MMDELSFYTLSNNQPIVQLDCRSAFNSLSSKEKKYAHFLSQASVYGGLIALVQTSHESPIIFAILHKIFLEESIASLKNKAFLIEISEEDFTVSTV